MKLTLLALSIFMAAPAAMAQEQQPKPTEVQKNSMKAQADLHERIAKAHKNTAKCLKDGKKPESECVSQLSKECQSTGATEQCMPMSQEDKAGQMDDEQEPSSK